MTSIFSSIVLGVLVIGGGLTYTAVSHGNSTTSKPTDVSQPLVPKVVTNAAKQTTSAHLISLQAREHTVSSKQAQQYHAIPVLTSTGQSETLNVADAPVVFVSDMDPSILQQLAGGKYKHEPTIVVTWPKPNETVKSELENVQKEAKSLSLKETVVALNGNSKKWITGVPDTYVEKNGKVTEIPGILPANTGSKWTSVFN